MRTRSTFSFEPATLEGSLFVPDRLEKFAQGALDSELPLRLPVWQEEAACGAALCAMAAAGRVGSLNEAQAKIAYEV